MFSRVPIQRLAFEPAHEGLWVQVRDANPSTIPEKWEPTHPSEVLVHDLINGVGITQNKLAVSIGGLRARGTPR